MKDYEIKMDGAEHKFGEATRYTKDGKGRFDLIQPDVACKILSYITKASTGERDTITHNSSSIVNAYRYGMSGDYVRMIVCLMMHEYGNTSTDTDSFVKNELINFNRMLYDLAVHFQKGAEKYGERNCEMGIPEWSFKDSGLRHTCQYINGNKDENHFISAIWNFWMAVWTVMNHPERCIGYKAPTNKEDTRTPDGKCVDNNDGNCKYKLKNDGTHHEYKKLCPKAGEEPESKYSLKSISIKNLMGHGKEALDALMPVVYSISGYPKFALWLNETYREVDVWDLYVALVLFEYDEPLFNSDGSMKVTAMNKFVCALDGIRHLSSEGFTACRSFLYKTYPCSDKSIIDEFINKVYDACISFLTSDIFPHSLMIRMTVGELIDSCRN